MCIGEDLGPAIGIFFSSIDVSASHRPLLRVQPVFDQPARFAKHVPARLFHLGQIAELNLKQHVVCAVHGYCIGSGLEIALFCDLRLAARGTIFAMPEVQLGMIPAAGGTQTLPRNTGWSQALELLLTGRRFDAGEALALGLISRVVADEDLSLAGLELAQSLVGGDSGAINAAKSAIGQGLDLPLAQGLTQEKRLSARLLAQATGD